MEYIYDILLNFKDTYYDFYDWNKNDNVIHIRKIPIYKISTYDLYNIKNNKVKIDINFIEKIENKTEIFTNNGVKKIKNSCLLSDGETVVGINIQKKLKISSLLIDEELDVLEDLIHMDIEDIKYKVIQKNKEELKTRNQIEIEKYLKKELNKIYDVEKLKYIYYECFNVKENNIDNIMNKLNNINDDKIKQKLYKFLTLKEVNK